MITGNISLSVKPPSLDGHGLGHTDLTAFTLAAFYTAPPVPRSAKFAAESLDTVRYAKICPRLVWLRAVRKSLHRAKTPAVLEQFFTSVCSGRGRNIESGIKRRVALCFKNLSGLPPKTDSRTRGAILSLPRVRSLLYAITLIASQPAYADEDYDRWKMIQAQEEMAHQMQVQNDLLRQEKMDRDFDEMSARTKAMYNRPVYGKYGEDD